MKNIVFTLLLLFLCITAMAQKCKYDVDKKDPFTGKTLKAINLTLNKSWEIGVSKLDNQYILSLGIVFPGDMVNVINKGDTLMLALENEKPLILFASENALPISNVVGSGVYRQIRTYYNSGYVISAEQLNILVANKITAVKIYMSNLFYVVDVPAKNAGKISKAASCIQQ